MVHQQVQTCLQQGPEETARGPRDHFTKMIEDYMDDIPDQPPMKPKPIIDGKPCRAHEPDLSFQPFPNIAEIMKRDQKK